MTSRKATLKHVGFALFLSALLVPLPAPSAALTPVDYLVPPPPPHPAVLQRTANARPPTYLTSESRPVPQYPNAFPGNADKSRIPRWFGFGNYPGPQQQQLAPGATKQLYFYSKPVQQQQQQQQQQGQPCLTCNTNPWMPMLPANVHYALAHQWSPQPVAASANPPSRLNYGLPQTEALPQQLQHSTQRQRAIQFNFPHPNLLYLPARPQEPSQSTHHDGPAQYSAAPFLPIPIPNLSPSAIPPLYSAQPFRPPLPPPQPPQPPSSLYTPATQQPPLPPPSLEPERDFVGGSFGAHSEQQAAGAVATQTPPPTTEHDASVEIVKSIQLTDFESSVDYPATFEHSQAIDIAAGAAPPFSHKPEIPEPEQTVNAGHYQPDYLDPKLSNHTPASQLLTDPRSFAPERVAAPPNSQQSWLPSQSYVSSGAPTRVAETGRFPPTSGHNASLFRPNHPGSFDTVAVESNDFIYTTPTPDGFTARPQTPTATQVTPSSDEDFTTQGKQDYVIEFIPSVQTDMLLSKTGAPAGQASRQRESPKHLLKASIQHSTNIGNLEPPRPFRRDPAELDYRPGAPANHKTTDEPRHPNHSYNNVNPQWSVKSVSYAAPIPTAPHSAMDVSIPSVLKEHEQIAIPYITENQPRPFEPTRDSGATRTGPTAPATAWTQSRANELRSPLEAKLVGVKSNPTETPSLSPSPSPAPTPTPSPSPPLSSPRSTKYLTKILASNLRELLQRESEKKMARPNGLAHTFDFSKLQKNIDDWTEQEYTSISHRPSTPTIRGRFKHIPAEYLTTTTTQAPTTLSRSTQLFEEATVSPTSINNLEPLLINRGSKRFYFSPIDDNFLSELYIGVPATKKRPVSHLLPPTATTTTTTAAPTPTTRARPTTAPMESYYINALPTLAPAELWKKAKVSISPQTKEKVYVVTPQPRFFPQRLVSASSTESPSTGKSGAREPKAVGGSFKSPRFLVRPTPGNANNFSEIVGTSSSNRTRTSHSSEDSGAFVSAHSPQLFGLRGVSAYVPAQPVEIINGKSKVLTSVTSSSLHGEASTDKGSNWEDDGRHSRKPTMSPSPR